MDRQKPRKKISCLKFDDDVDFNFRDIPSVVVTMHISASETLKDAINRVTWYLQQITITLS